MLPKSSPLLLLSSSRVAQLVAILSCCRIIIKMGDCQTRQSEIPPSEGEVDIGVTSNTDNMNSCSPSLPSSLSIFHEDILLAILSFVADTPFEMVNGGK
jgi:hypothetical protein